MMVSYGASGISAEILSDVFSRFTFYLGINGCLIFAQKFYVYLERVMECVAFHHLNVNLCAVPDNI